VTIKNVNNKMENNGSVSNKTCLTIDVIDFGQFTNEKKWTALARYFLKYNPFFIHLGGLSYFKFYIALLMYIQRLHCHMYKNYLNHSATHALKHYKGSKRYTKMKRC